jgi:hypothetical protein
VILTYDASGTMLFLQEMHLMEKKAQKVSRLQMDLL